MEEDKVAEELMRHASEEIPRFYNAVYEKCETIITKYIGISLEEAKSHSIRPVWNKNKDCFLGLWCDGVLYDCKGTKYSIEFPYLEDIINEYEEKYQCHQASII